VTTKLRPGTGDKLADIETYAIDLQSSRTPEEAEIGRNLMLILKGKPANAKGEGGTWLRSQ
jgi:hypothetical protein